ncbi:MAG TPA: DUF58 domain-containing protein [Alphaproteobacteria bacterium]|nr:DUF58 domain-containing protein [Alphaproteobacteria bacterium]
MRPALLTQQRAEQLASTLPPLLVAAERVAMTVAQGVHGRRRVGQGETFWQFRRYQPGDSAEDIDWRQTAKTDRIFVRETEWEASESVWLWRDSSPSMHWRSNQRLPEKSERADLLTLALAALLIRGGEQVGLMGASLRPSMGRAALTRIAEIMARPSADASRSLPPADIPLPRYAQVALVSDFLTPLDQVAAAVRRIAARGVKGYLLQVLDPAEETLPFSGRTRFVGLESEGEMLVPRVEALRGDYQAALAAHVAGLADIARQVGWTFLSHRTDRPPEATLLALFMAFSGGAFAGMRSG